MERPGWYRALASWREPRGILRFAADNFHVTLDPWQEEALLAIENPAGNYRRVALQACVGPGKSAVLAWAGWWFLGTKGREGEHPKGLVTAITKDNLQANLWAEYAKWQQRSPFLQQEFEWTSRAIFNRAFPSTWRLEARSWPKTANPEQQGQTFSGLHERNIMVQVDESGNVPPAVLRAAEQALVRVAFGKLLQAGNPTSLEGMLYAAATLLRHQWHVIRITGDPDDPKAWVHSPRLQADHKVDLDEGETCLCPTCWARQQIETYGRDNPWVKTQILGQFPPASINALLGVEEVEEAMARTYRPEDYNWHEKRLGVDVARFGDDRSVIFPRQGLMTFKPVEMRNLRTTDIAARVAAASIRWAQGDAAIFVDDTGHWGHGVLDQLIVGGYSPMPVVFHAKALNPRYANRRAEMWIEMANWVKRGGRLPKLPSLVGELTVPTYTFHNGAQIIEEKDQIKKRLGRSPDVADALALTFAMPDMASPDARVVQDRGGRPAITQRDELLQSQQAASLGRVRRAPDFEE